jgi:16S rRNA (cytidine1402-2'-O)-methyltransferase
MSGTLFVVATPIGNLGDISPRAIETLAQADYVLCEDTRVTKRLLENADVTAKLVSFNAQSETKKIDAVINDLLEGKTIALVSDAGTPAISDPGVRLVNAALKNGVRVSGIPGANAAILALSVSGIPTDSFVFEGFLPQKKGRQKKLKELAEEKRTIVLYESPYRIEKLLNEINEYMPNRFLAVNRELTKKFEEIVRGTAKEILERTEALKTKGEFVVVIAPKDFVPDK